MKKYDVAIIGGGAAGIYAAITASGLGKEVILIEKNESLGRKLLATGNGRCNLTNTQTTVERYHGSTKKFINSVLSNHDQNETIKNFETFGLVLKEEDNGRIFPITNSAKSVLDVLCHKLYENNVEILTSVSVNKIEKSGDFSVFLDNNQVIKAEKVIVTTGGKASFYLGSSGDGLFWAKKFGHTITPIYSALVPVETVETYAKDIQGLKMDAKVSVFQNNKFVSSKSGDLLFTHFGVSGPAIMSQARNIAPILENEGVMTIMIDFFRDHSSEDLENLLLKIFNNSGKKTIKNSLLGVLPASLINVVLDRSKIKVEAKTAEISKDQRKALIKSMKEFTLEVKNLRPLKEAQVTAGGISTSEINSETMESKIVPGLYFAGEILDVDGDSGGFNLQWAWSSGYTAGKNA